MVRPLIVALLPLAFCVQLVAGLWPNPQKFAWGSEILRLAENFDIDIHVSHAPSDLQEAVERTKDLIRTDKLERLVVGRGANEAQKILAAKALSKLTISITGNRPVQSISTEATLPLEDRNEAYALTVPSDGSAATLTAESTLGLLRGLTTFSQHWYDFKGTTYAIQTPIDIKDWPAFAYRGFMLDTARNFFPVGDIKRTLDAMSAVKLSQFHLHATDTQSWPLHIVDVPELSQAGAYSPQSVYTADDINDITTFAAKRGIDVVVEIDTPGHTGAISYSHPELVACSKASPWTQFANEPPSGQLRFMSPKARDFAVKIFNSVAHQFPSKYISTGGDELNMNCFAQDAEAQADLKASGQTFEQALDTFTQATHGALHKAGKTPLVWEEMVLNHNVTLSNNTIAKVWISSQNVAAVVQKGFRVIHTASDFFYLDCGGGGWVGDNPGGNSWCDPFKTWQKIYSFDPYANLSPEQHHLITGGETLLWTEQTDPSNMDSQAWPRTAANAEVWWTGAMGPDGNPRNGTEALPRLHDIRYRLVQRGVRAIPLQPLWCALRPDACDLHA